MGRQTTTDASRDAAQDPALARPVGDEGGRESAKLHAVQPIESSPELTNPNLHLGTNDSFSGSGDRDNGAYPERDYPYPESEARPRSEGFTPTAPNSREGSTARNYAPVSGTGQEPEQRADDNEGATGFSSRGSGAPNTAIENGNANGSDDMGRPDQSVGLGNAFSDSILTPDKDYDPNARAAASENKSPEPGASE
ncbi:MAG: hypothetical protein D6763_07330, partial [Alphaproteobacteria bacterium]